MFRLAQQLLFETFFAPINVQPVTVQTALRRVFQKMNAQILAVRTSQTPSENSVADWVNDAVNITVIGTSEGTNNCIQTHTKNVSQ